MTEPLLATEALPAGVLTRGALRWNYNRVLPRVHVPKDAVTTLASRTTNAWLWSDRQGVIAGRAAAALHGAQFVEDTAPIEVITQHTRKRPGVIVREERIADDEICQIGEFRVTTPARTALDLGRHLLRDDAVSHLDALGAATGITPDAALAIAARYRGARHP